MDRLGGNGDSFEFTNSSAYTTAAPDQQTEAALKKLIRHKVTLP